MFTPEPEISTRYIKHHRVVHLAIDLEKPLVYTIGLLLIHWLFMDRNPPYLTSKWLSELSS